MHPSAREPFQLSAPIGQEVGITYDWAGIGPEPGVGHGLVTSTSRAYVITEARKVNSKIHPNRYKLRAVVVNVEDMLNDPPPVIFTLEWNPRKKSWRPSR